MNDDVESPAAADPESAATETAEQGGRTRARVRKWLVVGGVGLVVVPALCLALWMWITLSWTYSTGDRAGYVQKFSQKGWVCSTWEGELSMVNLPGAVPERWTFSVRDDIVAHAVRESIGHKVALEYEEHRGVPSNCFGETRYFVVGVRRVSEP
jgi:hypothetical protein